MTDGYVTKTRENIERERGSGVQGVNWRGKRRRKRERGGRGREKEKEK
jgi:hypothetical protein